MKYFHLPLAGAMLLALNVTPGLFAHSAMAQAESKTVINAQGAGQQASNPPAAAGSQTTTTTPIPNSDNNYLDDALTWNHFLPARAVASDEPVYCIPPGTRVLGIKSSFDTVTKSATGADGKPVTSTQQYLEVVLDPRQKWGFFGGRQGAIAADQNCSPVVSAPQALIPGKVAYISTTDLGATASRGGIDFGALVVPFKAQLTGKQALTGSTSIGGYLGYRIPLVNTGLTFSPILFAGASQISTSATVAGVTASQTVAGLSYGFGMITRIKDSFQVGLILGYDHVDSAQPYVYNDKPWLSFEIGYSFAH